MHPLVDSGGLHLDYELRSAQTGYDHQGGGELWDKGLAEFIDAARMLRNTGAKFDFVGMNDSRNPANASESQVAAWVDERVVKWWGTRMTRLKP